MREVPAGACLEGSLAVKMRLEHGVLAIKRGTVARRCSADAGPTIRQDSVTFRELEKSYGDKPLSS